MVEIAAAVFAKLSFIDIWLRQKHLIVGLGLISTVSFRLEK